MGLPTTAYYPKEEIREVHLLLGNVFHLPVWPRSYFERVLYALDPDMLCHHWCRSRVSANYACMCFHIRVWGHS